MTTFQPHEASSNAVKALDKALGKEQIAWLTMGSIFN